MVSTPEVAGDLLFIGSCAGTFYALDRTTGKIRWSYDAGQEGRVEFHGNPLLTQDLIVIGTDIKDQPSGVGYVYAFQKATGEVRWRAAAGRGVASDIIRVGSAAYGVTLNDELISIDLNTGTLKWSFSTRPDRHDLLPAAPVASGDHIFFGDRDGGLYALNPETGKLAWKRDLGTPISTSLVTAGEYLYFGAANHVLCVDARTGRVKADYLADGWSFGRPVIAGDSLLIFIGETLTSMDLSLKKTRWRQKANGKWRTPRPHLWRQSVLVGNEFGNIFAFRISDGRQLWTGTFEGIIRSVGSADQVLYIGTRQGAVYACVPEVETRP